jgi:hypothetical protein
VEAAVDVLVAGLAAVVVVCMNCSVLSLLSFMFCGCICYELPVVSYSGYGAYLGPNLKYILESHTCICQFTLQEHNNVVIVFMYLLSLNCLCSTLLTTGFDVGLEGGDLLVNVRNVLLDDECQFLHTLMSIRI